MKTRIESLPRYQTTDSDIAAPLLNLVKLALLRIKCPLRFSIHGLHNIDIILDHEYWVCTDSSLNDIPVFAWTEFETAGRSDLHMPICCKLYSFHAQAELIVDIVKDEIQTQLNGLLHPGSPTGNL